MTARRPLPPHLITDAFSTAELRNAGLPPDRNRATDLERYAHGLHRPTEAPPGSWTDLDLPDPGHGLSPRDVRAFLRLREDVVVSHQSAAHLHGVPLPGWAAPPWTPPGDAATGSESPNPSPSPRTLHVSVPHGRSRVRRPGITEHQRLIPCADIVIRNGIRVTSPSRTWLDLATLTPRMTRDDLVIAGDHLVRHPWVTGTGRTEPATTPAEIRRTLLRVGRFRGVRAAREALELIRVGSDSPPESRLRLAFVDAYMPEPELQVLADPIDPSSPRADLGLPRWRIALQYEGAHHRDPRQQAMDARRDAWFQQHGWFVIKVTSEDLDDGFRRVIRLVAQRIVAAA